MLTNHLDLVEPKLPRFLQLYREFSKLKDPCVDWVRRKLVEKRLLGEDAPILKPYSALYYSVLRCQPSRPLWHLDDEVTHLITNAPIPYEFLETMPPLPYEGLYVTLPENALYMSGQTVGTTGKRQDVKGVPYEGFYLAKDRVEVEPGDVRDAISITAISKARRPEEVYFYDISIPEGRNAEGELYARIAGEKFLFETIGGDFAILSAAINLLLALQGKYLQEESPPIEVGEGRRPGMLGLGLVNPYTIIHLTQQAQRDLLGREFVNFPATHAPPTAHERREHDHCYWVRSPEDDEQILGRKEDEYGWKYLVRRVCKKHKVGEGPIKRPLYLVKK